MSSEDVNNGRRELLKTIGVTSGVITGGSLVSATGADTAIATDSPEAEWEKKDKMEDNANADIGVYLATDVGWYGATWVDQRNAWEHNFREDTTISSRDTTDGSDLCAIRRHEIYVTEGTTDGIGSYFGNDYHGVYPPIADDSYDYYDLAYDLAEVAISTLSTWAEFAFTASEITQKMHGDPGDGSSYPVHHYWDYNDNGYVYCDASNYKWWTADIEPNSTGSFDFVSEVEGTYDNDASVSYTFEISGDDQPTEGKVDNLSGGEITTTENGWTIEKISPANVPERASELPIPNETVETLLDSGKPAYFAHQAPIELIEN